VKKILLFALSLMVGTFQYASAESIPLESSDAIHSFLIEAHHPSCHKKKHNLSNPSSNFASIRIFRERNETLPEGSTIFVRVPFQEAIVTGGTVEFINDAGFIHLKEPGIYKITYGISALPGQRVRLFADNRPIRGTTLSCATIGQMSTLSIITFANESIALKSIDPIRLVQQADRDVTAFIEVIQLEQVGSESILRDDD